MSDVIIDGNLEKLNLWHVLFAKGILNMTNEIYLAGIIDGEGTFSVNKSMRLDDRSIHPTYFPVFYIANNNLDLMNFLVKNFSGKIYGRKNSKCYTWHCSPLSIVTIIDKILPYLIVKKNQAIVLRNFRNTFHGRAMKPTEKDYAIREDCWIKTKILNRSDRYCAGRWQKKWGITNKYIEEMRIKVVNEFDKVSLS